MKPNRLVAALMCATLGLASIGAFAQPHGGPDHDAGGPGHAQNDHAQNHPPAHAANGPHGPDRPGDHDDHDGPGRPDWRKGQRLSGEYRERQYVVDDWRGHGLHQPPRGYQWVSVGGDYLLVAVATGIIAQVLLSQ